MFSRLSYTIGAYIALATLDEVQSAIKTDTAGGINLELACAQCIIAGGAYYYGSNLTFGSTTTSSYGGRCCAAASDSECTAYKTGALSTDFSENEYAIAACPVNTKICGDRKIVFKKTSDTAVERTITELTFQDSCHYMIKTYCGAPQVQLKTITNVDNTKLKLTFLEWAPNGITDYGATKIASLATQIQSKKSLPPDGEGSPLIGQAFATKADAHKLLGGTIPLLGTKNTTAIAAAIKTQRGLNTTYKSDLTKYFTSYQAYIDSFIAILKENWMDYGMNSYRYNKETGEAIANKVLTAAPAAPAEPTAFTGDFIQLTDAGALKTAWEAGAGSPTKGEIVMDSTYGVAGALKNFGAFGQDKTGTPYYSNWRSELWHYNMNLDADKAQQYGADICGPKYLFLNVVYINNAETSVTKKDSNGAVVKDSNGNDVLIYTDVNMKNDAAGAGSLTLSFKAVASQTIDIFEPKLGYMDMKAQVEAGMPATTDIAALGTYYAAQGAVALGLSASAALVAASLY